MLSAEPKAEADNTYLDLDYSRITKTSSNKRLLYFDTYMFCHTFEVFLLF